MTELQQQKYDKFKFILEKLSFYDKDKLNWEYHTKPNFPLEAILNLYYHDNTGNIIVILDHQDIANLEFPLWSLNPYDLSTIKLFLTENMERLKKKKKNTDA